MNESNSSLVVSSQLEPHKNLAKLVCKYQQTVMQDSIPKHAHDAFKLANQFVDGDSIILDSGCGIGESSYRLAEQYPDIKVLAIDKSAARVQRSSVYGRRPDNLLIVQADCIYLWRLIHQAQWQIKQHYLLYPNPWPKPGHLQRRWHAHPVFPTLIALGGELTMRTNWFVYAQEFSRALELVTERANCLQQIQPRNAITPFERKYMQSGHLLYEVRIEL